MARKTLDSLYMASRGSPARVFMRAASENPLEADTHQFLLDHIEELDVDVLSALFEVNRADGVTLDEKRLVPRLAGLVPTADASQLLRVLRLSTKISAVAWIHDLTLPLQGHLPRSRWYRFVDRARGGNIFNALNVGIPRGAEALSWDPDRMFLTSIEEAREEPVVVPLLKEAHNDLEAAKFALTSLPIPRLLQLHAAADCSDLVTLDGVKNALRNRVTSTTESWAPREGMPRLPEWMAPFVVERLRHCGDEEARILYAWLFALPEGSHEGDAFALALERFGHTPLEPFWHPRIGMHLNTGASWKKRGREFLDRCIELGRGIPPETIRAALDAAAEKDGASVEKHRLAILRRIHDETASLLVERAERALEAGNYEAGDLFLSSLLSLDPGSYIGGLVHHLRKIPALPPEIEARIDACVQVARAGGRAPTEDAVYEAFRVLTRQLS